MWQMNAVLIIPLLLTGCDSARILGLALFPSRSHWIVMEPLFKELATRGHQVTVYSPFPQKKPIPNYTDVDFSTQLPPLISAFSIDMIREKILSPWKTTFFSHELHESTCTVLQDQTFQNLLTHKDKYDLLITELFGSDCYSYFAYKLKVPLISVTTSTALPWGAERVSLPDNPSYIPNYLVDFSSDMDFWQRTYNTVVLLYAKFWYHFVFEKRTQRRTESSFGEPLPEVQDVVANTSILFINSHYTLSQSRPFPPNVIEVGGIHIKERQPLPEDLQTILENSKNGVIIMSFGSLVRSSTLNKSVIMMFLKVFSEISQTVIFKYEEELPEAPSNVVTRNWLPQRDLIEHKHVIAVITHGGLSSTIEAVYFGKPMIGIPFFADQFVNIKSVVERGAGIQMDLDSLTEDIIKSALTEVVNNTKYTENMRRLSRQFRDRPMTALQTAVYWTEYVIRHQGAPHLRPASVGLPFYKYLLLDVIAILLLCLATLIIVSYLITKCVVSYLVTHKMATIINPKKTN